MSRAIVFDAYGGPDVLRTIAVDPPQPDRGQVLVRVRAAGVQPFDCLLRSGAAAQWMPASFPQRLGNELAGVIDALGDGVTQFSIGDEVLGWVTRCAYAEHVVVGVDEIVAKPAAMPWTEAAVVSASGQTAATALRQLAVASGDTVMIHAAAGGVGTFAVQIARARGATAIGTASERNHAYLRSLGAIPVAYGDGLAERVRAEAPQGVDAALDAAGSEEALRSSLELVNDRCRIGTVAFSPAARELGIRHITTERSASQLAELLDLYTAGELRIVIQDAFPLQHAAQAHRLVETKHVRGKVVLIAWGPTRDGHDLPVPPSCLPIDVVDT
jgi:enoyl reductase